MIRHIVMWRLSGATEPEKAAQEQEIRAALEPLRELVPSVRALDLVANAAYPETNFDVALVVDFDDVAGLEAYQVHPEHLAAAAVVRARVTERACVDYELE